MAPQLQFENSWPFCAILHSYLLIPPTNPYTFLTWGVNGSSFSQHINVCIAIAFPYGPTLKLLILGKAKNIGIILTTFTSRFSEFHFYVVQVYLGRSFSLSACWKYFYMAMNKHTQRAGLRSYYIQRFSTFSIQLLRKSLFIKLSNVPFTKTLFRNFRVQSWKISFDSMLCYLLLLDNVISTCSWYFPFCVGCHETQCSFSVQCQ